MGEPPLPIHPQLPQSGTRLDSWKEIAAYLKRDIRTVQRWEKQEALPVHRHLHEERGTAYAYSTEIDEWLKKRRSVENSRESRPNRPAVFIVAAATLAAIASRGRLVRDAFAFRVCAALESGDCLWTLRDCSCMGT